MIAFTIVILRVRRVNLRRDGQDYKGTATDVLNIMKNSDFEAHKAMVRFGLVYGGFSKGGREGGRGGVKEGMLRHHEEQRLLGAQSQGMCLIHLV